MFSIIDSNFLVLRDYITMEAGFDEFYKRAAGKGRYCKVYIGDPDQFTEFSTITSPKKKLFIFSPLVKKHDSCNCS